MKLLSLLTVAALSTVSLAFAGDGLKLLDETKLKSTGSSYDYIRLDAERGHLYIGHRKEGLQVFDIKRKKIIRVIEDSLHSNSATLIKEFDLGISNNEDGTITPFKLSTGKALAKPIKLGEELDDSIYDPATKRFAVSMAKTGETSDFIFFDAATMKQVGVAKLPSKRLDGMTTDGKGNIYVNARDLNKIIKVDAKTMATVAEYPLEGCINPSGTAMDVANNRIFVGCRGKGAVAPAMVVVNADTGKVIYSHEIGRQNDGVIYDPETKRIYTGNGVDAVIVSFEQVDKDTYKPNEALGTRPGVRAFAYDYKTKRLYSMTAEARADFSKKINTGVAPFYPNNFTPDTFSVMTYGVK